MGIGLLAKTLNACEGGKAKNEQPIELLYERKKCVANI